MGGWEDGWREHHASDPVSLDMTSPHITTVLRKRLKKPLKPRRRSIREISHGYFGAESVWTSLVELLIFGILVVIVIWPMINAAAAIRALLL
jgi:hypothetical protein